MNAILVSSHDPHAQLRALYISLLTHQEHFDEFKELLAEYVIPAGLDEEPSEAATVRARLNDRIRDWVGSEFDGLSVQQVLQWRAIVVDERINGGLSPWRDVGSY